MFLSLGSLWSCSALFAALMLRKRNFDHKTMRRINSVTHFAAHMLLQCFMVCLAMSEKNITTDQFSLLALKARVVFDPQNAMANWSSTTESSVCSSWFGVTCTIRHQRVTSLNISNLGLIGSIPRELGNLSFLVSLDNSGNQFQGNLPSKLAR